MAFTLGDWPKVRDVVLSRATKEQIVDALATAVNGASITNPEKTEILNGLATVLLLDKIDLNLSEADLRRAEQVRQFLRDNTEQTEAQIDAIVDGLTWSTPA